jgi:nuclear GTP-binding protein
MGASDKKVKPKGSGRQTVKGVNFARQDEKKIKHIKMLANGHKAVRDRNGKIVEAAEFQSREAKPGMIQPDRRWFGASSNCRNLVNFG